MAKPRKTINKKSKERAFTLVELLAVIIILGVIFVIAIPSVINYVNNSRKSVYVTTAKNIINAARTKVSDGRISVYDTDTTYYIPVEMFSLETGDAKTPYGDFTQAYVVVTYNGSRFDYYWVSVDTTNTGVRFENYEHLDIDDIESNLELDSDPITGVDGRSKIVVFNKNGEVKNDYPKPALKQFNSTTSQIVGNSAKQICVVDDNNKEYYTYTGNPTIDDLIDNGTIVLTDSGHLDYFYTNEYETCINNNPHQDTSSMDYLNYSNDCFNAHAEKYPSYQEHVKDSTIGCYGVDYPK